MSEDDKKKSRVVSHALAGAAIGGLGGVLTATEAKHRGFGGFWGAVSGTILGAVLGAMLDTKNPLLERDKPEKEGEP